MIPERRKFHQEENVDSWLMSYADLITLLLSFFIVFVSASEPKDTKLAAVAEGMKKRFGLIDLTTPYQGLVHSLQTVTETYSELKDISVVLTNTGAEIELSADAFYQRNSADFTPEKLPVLLKLATTIKSSDYLGYHINVEGHTSDAPVATSAYPSNWELSSSRAARVVRLLIDNGIDPDRLRAVGYADSMPKVPNLDSRGKPIPENRARNDRIVIKIEHP
jgi:chemotaxis protein MotB